MPASINGITVGSGASLPGTPAEVLLDLAGAEGFVVLDNLGVGAAAPPAVASAFLAREVEYTFDSSTGWTLTDGSGTAAITSSRARLTMPTGTTSGDGGRASIVRDLSAITNPVGFKALVRLAALTNGDSNTQFGFILNATGGVTNELRFVVLPAGTVVVGYLGGGWNGLATAASTVAWDGTWWLELTITGTKCYARFGQGTSSEPPGETADSWRIAWSGDLFTYMQNGRPWDRLGMYLTTFGSGGGDITMDLDNVIVSLA